MVTPPLNPIRVGGEIDALCNKCELNLAHTILAMVGPKVIRVRCNTCGSDHQYRGTQPLVKAKSFSAPKKASAPRTSAAERVILNFEDQLKQKDTAHAKKYSARDTFQVDDVVDHPTFGRGFVTAVRGDKVDITFRTFEKTLVHGRTPPPEPAPAS